MTDAEAKHAGFTHKGLAYGFIKVYAKDIDFKPTVTRRNLINGLLLDLFRWADLKFGKDK